MDEGHFEQLTRETDSVATAEDAPFQKVPRMKRSAYGPPPQVTTPEKNQVQGKDAVTGRPLTNSEVKTGRL